MAISIYSDRWHLLAGQQIVELFNSKLPKVTILPNYEIVMLLKSLEIATLELIENRTSSTVYRIVETGVIYQVCEPNGDKFEFDDYESYNIEEPIDEVLEIYTQEEPLHRIWEKNGKIFIERTKQPRFTGYYIADGPLNNIEILEWIDPKPESVSELSNLMRKAGNILLNYLSN